MFILNVKRTLRLKSELNILHVFFSRYFVEVAILDQCANNNELLKRLIQS